MDDKVGKEREFTVTEKLLLSELNRIRLYPKTQYKISQMTVDFAFPRAKIVVEIDGPYHRERYQRQKDGNRDDFLQSRGWKVRRFTSEEVEEKPLVVAKMIKNFIRRNSLTKPESLFFFAVIMIGAYIFGITFMPYLMENMLAVFLGAMVGFITYLLVLFIDDFLARA